MIKGEANVNNARLLTLRSKLNLEIAGMKFRGKTAYAILKKELQISGTKKKVYEETTRILKERGILANE